MDYRIVWHDVKNGAYIVSYRNKYYTIYHSELDLGLRSMPTVLAKKAARKEYREYA
jgi:hypothetical protein